MASDNEQLTVANTIKTPLAFAAMMVTSVEAIALGIAGSLYGLARLGEIFLTVFFVTIGDLVLMLLVVFAIIYFIPEALWGKRYSALEEHFAKGMGEEIHWAVDGYFSNGTTLEREDAYEQLQKGIETSDYASSKATRKFCSVLVKTIKQRAELTEAWTQIEAAPEKA
jgi:hypothetical protein